MLRAVALAWLQLRHRRLRLLVAVAGVTFAVILMLMQLGFSSALYASTVRLHERLAGEVVLIGPQSKTIFELRGFPRSRLYQALGVPGVREVTAIYSGMATWRNLDTREDRRVFVVGIDPSHEVLTLPEVNARRESLQREDTILFDRRSRPEYGPIAELLREGRPINIELDDRRVSIAGTFELGPSFSYDGMVVMSDANFLRIVRNRPRPADLIQVGLVRVDPPADAEVVRAKIAAELPPDVVVLTREQYVIRENRHWANVTPIGFIFNFGAVMGFVVGGVIVYQILFADVSDHLAEYATLKAVGHTDDYLARVVVCQAVVLACLGFLPGFGLAWRFYRLTADATKLPMRLSPEIGLGVFVLTVVMCAAAGLMAMRRVRSADPADIF
jgi:putative ABC transport system permease protein